MEDALEFTEQLKGLLNVLGLLELVLNVLLKLSLDLRNIDVEFDEVTIKQVLVVIKELVVLLFEPIDSVVELLENRLNVLKVVLLQSLELLDGTEQVNEFLHTTAEELELTEDLVRREIELLGLGHVLQALSGKLVLLLVSVVKLKAAVEHSNELSTWVLLTIPKGIISKLLTLLEVDSLAGLDLLEVQDVLLTVLDHLIGDLDEEASHAFISVIVTSDGMDHLDTVHQGRQGLLDGNWITIIKRLDELLKSLQVLNIILGFVKSLGNSQVDVAPFGGSQMQLISRCSTAVTRWLTGGIENIVDGTAVLRVELLRDTGKLAHALLPVFELGTWTSFLLVLAFTLGLFNIDLDLIRPIVKDLLERGDHVRVDLLSIMDVLGLVFVFLVILFKSNTSLETLKSFLKLVSELVKDVEEFLLLFILTLVPISRLKLLNQWFEHIVNNSVHGVDGVFRDLTEEDLIVGLGLRINRAILASFFVLRGASEEVDTLAEELDVFTIRDGELVLSVVLVDFTGLSDLVGLLVVDEEARRASTLHPSVKLVFKFRVGKWFKCFGLLNTENIF